MIASINLREKITPLANKLMRRLLYGEEILCREFHLISSVGDGLPLLVIRNLLRIGFLFVKGKNFAGDDISVATCWG